MENDDILFIEFTMLREAIERIADSLENIEDKLDEITIFGDFEPEDLLEGLDDDDHPEDFDEFDEFDDEGHD